MAIGSRPEGDAALALIEAAAADGFPAEIALVISNRGDAPGLATAQANGVKTLVIESKPFESVGQSRSPISLAQASRRI